MKTEKIQKLADALVVEPSESQEEMPESEKERYRLGYQDGYSEGKKEGWNEVIDKILDEVIEPVYPYTADTTVLFEQIKKLRK